MDHKEPSALSHLIPCGHGFGGQLTREEVSVGPGGTVLVTLNPSTLRTAGTGGEQRVLETAWKRGWSDSVLLSYAFAHLVFCCNLIWCSCRNKCYCMNFEKSKKFKEENKTENPSIEYVLVNFLSVFYKWIITLFHTYFFFWYNLKILFIVIKSI